MGKTTTTTGANFDSNLQNDGGGSATPANASDSQTPPAEGGTGGAAPGASGTATPDGTTTPAQQSGGGVWPMLPSAIADHDFGQQITTLKATVKGQGKGKKEPGIASMNDLLTLVTDMSQNKPESEMDQETLNKVYSQAKVPRPNSGLSATIDQGVRSALFTRTDVDKQNQAAIKRDQENKEKAFSQAWKDLVTAAHGTVGIPPNLRKAPSLADAGKAIEQIKALPVSQAQQIELKSIGILPVDSKNPNYTVGDLAKDQDSFEKGAPGSPGSAAQSTTKPLTASDYYNQMMESYNSGASQGNDWLTQLAAANYIKLTPGQQPSDSEVGAAATKMIQQAISNGKTPAQWLGQQVSTKLPSGEVPSSDETQAYLVHIANQIGTTLSGPQLVQAESAITQAGGVSSAAGEDLAVQWVTLLANQNLSKQVSAGTPPTNYTGWAAMAAENTRTAYAQMGVPISDAQVAGAVQKVMATSPTSIYSAGDAATSMAQDEARTAAIAAFPSIADQLKQDTPLTQIAQQYTATASKLLGIGTSDINLADPKWTAWASNGDTPMTQEQWATKLMSDPQYGYATSPTAKASSAAASNGLLQLMGAIPQQGLPTGASVQPDISTSSS